MTIFAFAPGGAARLRPTAPARWSSGTQANEGGTFRVPDAAAFEAAPSEVNASAETALSAAIRQPDAAAERRNRAARRHGQDLLAELAQLQHGLLGHGDGGQTTLARLAGLASAMPAADDPRLGEILDGIVLRAQVEIARRLQP